MKKCVAFLLSVLLLLGSTTPTVVAVSAENSSTTILDVDDVSADTLTLQQNETEGTPISENEISSEESVEGDNSSLTIAEEYLTEKRIQLFALEAPVYKDHIFYGSRTGNVLMFENYNTIGEKKYVIQSSVNGVPVRGIEEEALYGVTGDATILIPESVTTIPAWDDLTASGYTGGFTGDATIVCEDDSPAQEYAEENQLPSITPQENQQRIDAKTFSDKTITVLYNERGFYGGSLFPLKPSVKPADDENCYLATKNGEGVTVTLKEYDATSGKAISLDESGSATIKASNAAILEIKKDGYATQSIDFKNLSEDGTKIYLEPEGDIVVRSLNVEYVDENGVTAYMDVYHDQYVVDRYSDEVTKLIADVDWGNHGTGTISLYQTGSEVAFTGNSLSFVLKNRFDTAEKIYLIAKAADGTTLKRKINIDAADFFLDGLELDLTKGLKIKIPNKIPFLGGESINVDLGKLPVDICVENGKVYAVVGFNLIDYSYKDAELGNGKPGRNAKIKSLYLDVKNGFKENKKGVSSVGEQLEKTKKLFTNKNFSSYIRRVHQESSVTGDVQAMGYLEGSLRPNGTIAWGDAQIIILAEGKVEFSGQYTLGPVPMYWKVYLKGDGQGSLSVVGVIAAIAGSSAAPFQPLGSVELGIALGGSTGVGVNNLLSAGGGVEGSAKVDFTFKRDVGNYKLGGKFSVFVEAKALWFSWNKKWDVLQGTWTEGNIYGGTTSLSAAHLLEDGESSNEVDMSGMYIPSRYQLEDQSYLAVGGAFTANDETSPYDSDGISMIADGASTTNDTPLTNAGNELKAFKENTYQFPEAQMVQLDNGTQVMIWLDGAPGRVSPNMTAVYYSYRPNGSVWSSPAIIADDGTADFLPVLASSGTAAWIVWQNANTAFSAEEMSDAETAMPKTAAAMEICVARFNGTGFDQTISLTNNSIYDSSPVLAVNGEEAAVYWLQSSSNNLLGTNNDSRVMKSVYRNKTWSAAETVYQASSPVKSLAAGWDVSGARYAVALDMDGNPETTNDMELVVDGTSFTKNAIIDSSPIFSNGTLYWYQEGTVVSETGKTMLPEGILLDTDQFQIYTDTATGDTALVYIVSNGAYAEVYAIFQNGDVISQPTALTEVGVHTESGLGYYTDNTLFLPCPVTAVSDMAEGTEDGIENIESPFGKTDLNLLTYEQSVQLSIENVAFDSSRLVAGNNFTVYVTVRNNGTLPAEGFDVVLWDTPEKMPTNGGERNPKVSDYRAVQSLAGGETVDIPLSFTLPEDFAGDYELTLTEGDPATAGNYDDALIYKKAIAKETVTFSDWDLIMTAEMVQDSNGQYVAKGVIGNTGKNNLSGLKVSLYAVDIEGETETLIDTQMISVKANSQTIVAFTLSEPTSEFYRIDVAEQIGEVNIANNSDFCVLWDDTEEDDGGYLLGDADKDGTVTMNDATMVARHVAKIELITDPVSLANAEVTGDAGLTMDDATKIARYVAKIISSLE